MNYVLHIFCIMSLSGALMLDAVEISKKSVKRQNNRLKQAIMASDLQLPTAVYSLVFAYVKFKTLSQISAEFADTIVLPLDDARREQWLLMQPPKKQLDRTIYM